MGLNPAETYTDRLLDARVDSAPELADALAHRSTVSADWTQTRLQHVFKAVGIEAPGCVRRFQERARVVMTSSCGAATQGSTAPASSR
jgi:hypothetical protein